MGALDMGIPESDLQDLVNAWREANANIVNFWYETENKAIKTVKDGQPRWTAGGRIVVKKDSGFLRFVLPSGRSLNYPRPRLVDGQFGPSLAYEDGKTLIETYGGKLVENLVQATARDILAEGLKQLEAKGYQIVFHVHDEVVIEAPKDLRVDRVNELLAIVPEWAEGLPLNAEGFETEFYMKD